MTRSLRAGTAAPRAVASQGSGCPAPTPQKALASAPVLHLRRQHPGAKRFPTLSSWSPGSRPPRGALCTWKSAPWSLGPGGLGQRGTPEGQGRAMGPPGLQGLRHAVPRREPCYWVGVVWGTALGPGAGAAPCSRHSPLRQPRPLQLAHPSPTARPPQQRVTHTRSLAARWVGPSGGETRESVRAQHPPPPGMVSGGI